MFMRQVIITRYSNIADPEGLSKHELVRKVWKLPKGYILCELYDPAFEFIYSRDMDKHRAAHANEEIRARAVAIVAEEMALFAPLYGQEKRRSPFLKLDVICPTGDYRFLDKRSILWPELGHSPNWERSRSVNITGQLKSTSKGEALELQRVFQEWVDAMTSLGEVSQVQSISLAGEKFTAAGEFTGACGDATMALYMLLAETKKITTVQSVGFFLPTDTNRRYLPIGRAAKR